MRKSKHPDYMSSHLLITAKMRDRIIEEGLSIGKDEISRLREMPFRHGYVAVDLASDVFRAALWAGIQRFTDHPSVTVPPALVGSARRAAETITAYERRRSNYDLFEDHHP